MDVGAALSALTVLIVPSLGKVAMNATPLMGVALAPTIAEAAKPSIQSFWSSSITIHVEDADPKLASIARGAVETWNADLDGEAFTVTDNRPSIEIVFRSDLQEDGQPIAGLTSWARDSRGVLHAQLQLRTKTPNGRNMPEGALRQAALHELGHALGLEDNPLAGQVGGVMGELDLRHPAKQPSTGEVLAVRRLRETSYWQAFVTTAW
jgi:hypothetical protein